MRWKVLALVLGAAVIVGGCGGGDSDKGDGKGDQKAGAAKTGGGATTAAPTSAPVKRADSDIREPAVAGLWYPADPRELVRVLDRLLTATVAGVPGKVRGMIVPHAAYPFSGITAAVAFKQIMGQDINTVYVLGASHTAMYDGASIPPFKAFRTPLGDVLLSPKAAELAKAKPFVGAPFVEIKQRPGKQEDCSKLAPPAGQDTPHTWEHSIECQLPFLQATLKSFQLVPILYGKADPDAVARALADKLDDKSLIVVSTDLSHYHPYDEARSLDAWCLKAVQEMDLATMATQEACARPAVLTLMQIAKDRKWKPNVLDYRTSGDVSAKADKDKVVGYMAVVFTEGGKEEPLTGAEKEFLLKLARKTVANAVQGKGWPTVDISSLTPNLRTPRGAFVTLKEDNKLRGCIGYTVAIKPLFQAVMETAASAALRDTRFKPVTADELDKIVVEISVLTLPKSIYYNAPPDLLTALRPKVDGVVLEVPVVTQGRQTFAQAVYLPVVWEEIPEPEKFMDQLAKKAGLAADAWRHPQARVLTFQAEDFKEAKAPGPAATTNPAK